ncbi:MAG TPA: hypothetical protein VLE26_02540 [Alphaproteobacteria bacterium]|nr:hypothetical protein [Alphaproteobacteria bacterium]
MQDTERPDPFTIPGTDTLRNHFNLSGEALDRLERLHTQIRQEQPLDKPEISVAGFKAIHRHLLETVYPWAGDIRTSHTLTKGDASFLPGRFVPDALTRQFDLLKSERNLKGLAPEAFAERAAFHIREINYIRFGKATAGPSASSFVSSRDKPVMICGSTESMPRRGWMQAARAGRRRILGP